MSNVKEKREFEYHRVYKEFLLVSNVKALVEAGADINLKNNVRGMKLVDTCIVH
jgi:hypothetical protein